MVRFSAAIKPGAIFRFLPPPASCTTIDACFASAQPLRGTDGDASSQILRWGDRIFEHRVNSFHGPDESTRYELHVLRDISASWRLSEERRFIERLYRTLSHCNQALVRARDAQGLAQGVCDGLIQYGGYAYSSVSVWLNGAQQTFEQTAWAKSEAVSPDLAQRLQQTSRQFIETQLVHLFERPQAVRRTPSSVPAQEYAGDLASPIAIECYPLIDGGSGMGALIVASTPGDFDRAREFGLIEELAGDLAFGLETLGLREKAARLESEHLQRVEHQRNQFAATTEAIAAMVEMRDAYTAGHQRRVRRLAEKLGKTIGLDPDRLDGLGFAAGIHDIGKIRVPAEILTKPTQLSPIEFEIIKTHAEAGAAVLDPIAFPWPVAEIVRQHHERMDGSGYPRGLRGADILLEARILAVADVVEAMSTHRPYRPAHTLLEALQFLTQNRGTLFDPQVVDACLKLLLEDGYSLADDPLS